jgi:transcriptional regulator with XRE-family HTH domain
VSDTRAQVAASLKALRLRHGYSLAEVARATSVSKSFLSLVESGRSDITIGRLLRLMTFYGAKIDDLLPTDEPRHPVAVRRGEERQLASPVEGLRLFLLAPNIERTMTPSLGVFEPTGASAERATHDGEEFLYILAGEITLELEGSASLELRKGDSAYFRADRPHSYRNSGRVTARFLTVAHPPTF